MEISGEWKNKASGELVLVLYVSEANVSYQTEYKTIGSKPRAEFLQDFEQVAVAQGFECPDCNYQYELQEPRGTFCVSCDSLF